MSPSHLPCSLVRWASQAPVLWHGVKRLRAGLRARGGLDPGQKLLGTSQYGRTQRVAKLPLFPAASSHSKTTSQAGAGDFRLASRALAGWRW